MNPIFMLVGPPAVGKSSTSRALAARFPTSIHIPVDDIRHMVVSGLVLPSAVWGEDLVRQFSLARASVIHMALTYRQAGYVVVIDDVWDFIHSADYQPLEDQPFFHKVVLYPTQEEAHRRNRVRSGDSPARGYIDEGIREVYNMLTPVVTRLSNEGWHIVDSTTLPIEGVVSAILERTGSAPTT